MHGNQFSCYNTIQLFTDTFSLYQIVHDAEELLESARIAAEEARKKLNDARLQLRLKRKEFKNGM